MSGKKKKKVAGTGPVWHQTAEEATLARMPRYNAHMCRTGAHGDAKYNRARQKQSWQRELKREGACSRRLLPFVLEILIGGKSRLALRRHHECVVAVLIEGILIPQNATYPQDVVAISVEETRARIASTRFRNRNPAAAI